MTATLSRSLPAVDDIAEALSMLFGDDPEDVTINLVDGEASGRRADYETESDKSACVLVADDFFATLSAAKLLMVPAPRANEMAAAGERTDAIDEGFFEIANIAVTLFPVSKSARLSLAGVDVANVEELTEESHPNRQTYEVTVPNYGSGKVTMYTR